MRDLVNRRSFLLRKSLDSFLFKLMPKIWVPLYTSVTFSNMRYHKCIENKKWQDKVSQNVISLQGKWSNSIPIHYMCGSACFLVRYFTMSFSSLPSFSVKFCSPVFYLVLCAFRLLFILFHSLSVSLIQAHLVLFCTTAV